MTPQEKARALRPLIEKAASYLSDSDALGAVELFPEWDGGGVVYSVGKRVRHDGVLYSCLQEHSSQDDWAPGVAPSLWSVVLIPDPEVIPDWVQPDATNAYMTGDKVRFEGNVYTSLIDNNVWSPAAYPAGWGLVE